MAEPTWQPLVAVDDGKTHDERRLENGANAPFSPSFVLTVQSSGREAIFFLQEAHPRGGCSEPDEEAPAWAAGLWPMLAVCRIQNLTRSTHPVEANRHWYSKKLASGWLLPG